MTVDNIFIRCVLVVGSALLMTATSETVSPSFFIVGLLNVMFPCNTDHLMRKEPISIRVQQTIDDKSARVLQSSSLVVLGRKAGSSAFVDQQLSATASAPTTFSAYTINPRKQHTVLYWKNAAGDIYGSIQALRTELGRQHKQLSFAMNAGMFHQNLHPVGLLIQDGVVRTQLNTSTGTGNFFLKPNGVFYLTRKNKAVVCATEALPQSLIGIRFATQSGPMLVQDGHIHSAFNRESSNMVIRNGVGILPNGDILCVISNTEVTLFEIAEYFVRAGCKNALYLDGYVSRLYAPSLKRDDVQGTLGPILAVVE